MYATLRLVVDPLSDEDLLPQREEVAALTLSLVLNPVTFEVVAVPFGEDSVAGTTGHIPEAFVDISVVVDHSSLPMRLVVEPHPVIAVAVAVEHSASPVPPVVLIVARVLASQLPLLSLLLIFPQSSLSVSHVLLPHPLVSIFVIISHHTKSILTILFPVSNVFLILFNQSTQWPNPVILKHLYQYIYIYIHH